MVVSKAPPSRLQPRPLLRPSRRGDDGDAPRVLLARCGNARRARYSFTDLGQTGLTPSGSGSCPQTCPLDGPPDMTHLGSLTVLIAGAAVLSAAGALSRNRMRALSCLIAPIAAVLIVESVAKPLVGRHFEGTSALSYPSGTVAAVAALAAAASPRRASVRQTSGCRGGCGRRRGRRAAVVVLRCTTRRTLSAVCALERVPCLRSMVFCCGSAPSTGTACATTKSADPMMPEITQLRLRSPPRLLRARN